MPKKVCIIGAGAAGLVSAKLATDDGHEVIVFEQTDKVGGTWVYSDETGCHSSMYKIMKTNLPKEAMMFQNAPFRSDLPSFMSHEDVLEYLEEYSNHIPNICFKTTVTKVEREGEKWKISTKSPNSPGISTDLFDSVFICNGHFFEPLNLHKDSESIFQGRIIHSHDYRKAEDYIGRTVVIVGAGPSGIDIALQVCQTAEKVTLISKKAVYPVLPASIHQISSHVKKFVENGVETDEGLKIDADVVIVCTGYIFKFPFLDSSLVQLKYNGLMVSPLYEHLCHVDYPDSLFFIGLPLGTITFQLFEVQAKYALSLLSGVGTLPTPEEIHNFEENRIKTLPNPAGFHILVEEQWAYLEKLAKMGKFEHWKYFETIRKLYCWIMTERKKNVIGYKLVNFKMNDDDSDFEVVNV